MELPITAEQAQYLNTIARIASKYRQTAAYIRDDMVRGLETLESGHIPSAIRNQDAADILRTAGQLDALASIAYTVFPPTEHLDADLAVKHNKKVAEYLKAAYTLDGNDYIIMTFNR